MAQPTNTFSSYSAKGIREDLSDVIYNVSPDDTPFLTRTPKVAAKNTYVEWQTDALRTSAANANIEGDDTVATSRTATVRLGNYTQIFKDAVVIPDTDIGLDKAGRERELAYQILKTAKELKLDMEKALFANQARVVGSNVAARQLAGAPVWLTSNIGTVGVGGASGAGDGTTARTDGTARAFTQVLFDGVMQSIWTNGGKPDTVYLGPSQMNTALGFTGNNNQQSQVKAESEKVIKHMSVYVTPWGTVQFVPSRENRARDVFIMQDDMWAVANLRPMTNTELAKTGDSTRRQVVAEMTLLCKNQRAHGLIPDNL